MTKEDKIDEIQRNVFYGYLDTIKIDLEKCEDYHVVFNIGRAIGNMQHELDDQLEKYIFGDESEEVKSE